MIGNAKSFNEKNSQIFSDAEKVRKAVSNFMVENNPAYQTGDYKPFPTPIPEDWQPSLPKEEEPEEDSKEDIVHATRGLAARRASSVSTTALNGRAGSTPAVNDAEGVGEKFDGNSFQQAQEKIIAELISLKNDEYVFQAF